MNRVIKFRGLRTDGKGWVYGFLSDSDEINVITIDDTVGFKTIDTFRVIPETVGQFTGLTDKNGNEIYEGDIVSYYGSKEGKEIGYSKDGRLVWKVPQGHFTIQVIEIHDPFQMEVIGNIHNKPNNHE